MEIIVCLLVGYAIGTINPAYIIGAMRGVDIKSRGSGNAGASNVMIVIGKAAGVVCALLDIIKPCIAILITRKLFPLFELAFPLTGAACILGHVFPFYMKFKGGKGLACLGGVILMTDVRLFLALVLIELAVVLVINYICVVPMTASVAYSVIYGVMYKDSLAALIFFGVAVVIFFKHTENLKRIKEGTEIRFSFLWNKEEELERIKENGVTEAE